MMKFSPKGKQILCFDLEKFRSKPYLDSAKIPTIAFGATYYTNGKKVSMNDNSITLEQALDLFDHTIKEYEDCVNKVIIKPMTQNQFDAFVIMCYNVGPTRFSRPAKVAQYFNEGDIDSVYEWWPKSFITADGIECNGLKNRRMIELNLFKS